MSLVLEATAWTLDSWTAADLSLSSVVALAPPNSRGITWSRKKVSVFRVADGVAVGHDANPVDLDECFEARIFGEWGELRWLSQFGPTSTVAVGLAVPAMPSVGRPLKPRQGSHQIRVSHIVWGSALQNVDGEDWTTMVERRIGTIHVPIAGVLEHERVSLSSVEYVARADYGNAVVAEELLTGFEVIGASNG
jgi:CRISPR-associated protein (TIGR03984 family)